MTEKRFEIRQEDIICDCTDVEGIQSCIKCNGKFMTYAEIVKVLNEQHETIQQLKTEIKQLNHDLDLYEENNTNEVLNKLWIELTSRMNDCFEEFKE